MIKILKNLKRIKNNYVYLLEIFCENFWLESMLCDIKYIFIKFVSKFKFSIKLLLWRKKSKIWWEKKNRGLIVYVYYLVIGFLYMFFNCCIFLYKVYKM